VFADPQVKHLGMATKMQSPYVGEKEVVASAINISGFSKAIRSYTPDAGEHSDEILKDLGYTDAELNDMRQKGVI
jgi:crotonobetainyl-CoA:carnitine CoA-transferase CaiB-like acyl-CoA transferase